MLQLTKTERRIGTTGLHSPSNAAWTVLLRPWEDSAAGTEGGPMITRGGGDGRRCDVRFLTLEFDRRLGSVGRRCRAVAAPEKPCGHGRDGSLGCP